MHVTGHGVPFVTVPNFNVEQYINQTYTSHRWLIPTLEKT